MKAFVRAAVLTGLCLGASPPTVHAGDYVITPFVGKTFAATQTLSAAGLPVLASVDEQTWIIGVSAAWITSSVIGAEVDFGYAPRFFKPDPLNLVRPANNVVSLAGNALFTLPLSVTRDSLRPYATAGIGALHAGVGDSANVATVDRNLLATSIGGGAFGFLTPRAGIRFDLRYIKSTSKALDNATLLNEPRLGFWRATIGVALRY